MDKMEYPFFLRPEVGMHLARTLLWALAAALLATAGCSRSSPATPLERAALALQSADWDGAIDACNVTLNRDHDNARAYLLRGRGYQGRHDFKEALDDFTTAIRLSPKTPDAYYSRAIVYRKLGRDKDALADDVKGRQIDTNYRSFVDLDNRDKIRDNAAAIAEARHKARELAKKDAENRKGSGELTSFRSSDKALPKDDPLQGIFSRRPRPMVGHSPRLVKDAFGLPIDTSVGDIDFSRRKTFATPDGAPGQLPGTSSRLSGEGEQQSTLGRGPGNSAARRTRGRAAPNRRTAERQEAPADEFEEDGETASATPPRERGGSDRANPFGNQARTPFSGKRTSGYRSTDVDEPTVPLERGSRRTRSRDDDLGPTDRAEANRPNPFGRPAATPYNRGPRQRVTEEEQDIAE